MKPLALLVLLVPMLACAEASPSADASANADGAAPGAAVGGQTYTEGEDFERLPVPVETNTPESVQVTEFFSYACVHCFNFDPVVRQWRQNQGDGVVFNRVPAVFSDAWKLYARAYYAAEACGVLEQTHVPLFEAIHRKRRRFQSAESLASFFAEQVAVGSQARDQPGCTTERDFQQVFDSFAVRASVQQAIARGRAYRASGVPTMIVDGTWRVDGRMAGSNAAMLDVVDYLVRRARSSSAQVGAASASSADGS